MADNPLPPASGPMPRLPSSRTGRLLSSTTHLPMRKGGAGKIVVMLSSVAKSPPAGAEGLLRVAPLSDSTPKLAPADSSQVVRRPPPLPPKQVSPGNSPPTQPRLSTTTYVKLPPKTTSVPRLTSLSGKPIAASDEKASPAGKAVPPPLPARRAPPTQGLSRKTGVIKLNELSSEAVAPGESIFLQAGQPDTGYQPDTGPKPESWKNLEPGELNPPPGGLQSLEVFARSQRPLGKPTPETSLPEAKAPPLVAPPLLPPSRVETPASAPGAMKPLRPPPLPPPLAKPAESFASPPLHVAPPLLEKAPELPSEKLPPPHLPDDARKGEADLSGSPGVHKVPALIQPQEPLAKPFVPPPLPAAKGPANWLKKTLPLVLSSSFSKVEAPKIVEAKPALKPAVLPRRSLLVPREVEAAGTVEKSDATVPAVPVAPAVPEAPAAPAASAASEAQPPEATAPAAPAKLPETVAPPSVEKEKPAAKVLPPQPPLATPPAQSPGTGTPPSGEKEKPAAKVLPSQPPLDVPVSPKAKAPPSPTRAARAQKRRFWEVVVFYILFAVTVLALFFGGLYFCRDTRVEGQVIPPPGMTLNNEVWIVTNFSSYAFGIADDLAKERTPIMQEIQERQDHVQRAQADVASREERIRLIQEEIQASKDEITAIVKQSRDATQQVWDVDGAQIDAEYTARLGQLQKAIADRAQSLNLKYQPDDSYQSPEVWANTYRLALYDVPASVDTVKEHQWLGDEMKQWRDFLKTLDDRKEQLREKAAQIKLAPAPKITDLNSKIDELQQRSDGTAAEEVPLKAELQQAQADLGTAQASEAGLDDKYYQELDAVPAGNINKHIPLATNGRFTWVDDDPFAEGENEHHYWIFARATRADGRQYWALHYFSIGKNETVQLIIEPTGFISTKAILRPDLSPDEQEQ